MKKKELIGQKFGKLLVLEEIEKRSKSKKIYYKCICDCGNEVITKGASLLSGHTKSCKCLQKEKVRETSYKNSTHGLSKSHIYAIWASIKSRCNNPNNQAYNNYGGRGITICKEWNNSFVSFISDMGYPPTNKHSIDRIDNNKGYYKENCRWSDRYQQENNKRNNIKVLYNGELKTIAEISRETNVRYDLIYCRFIYRGWDINDAVNKPKVK